MKTIFLSLVGVLTFPLPLFAQDYCIGIRGNGENVAAHWSGLARIVEEKGMPARTAGGSSATVSMFFLDSIAGNSQIKGTPAEKRKMHGLLLKSLPEFVATMAKTDGLLDAFGLMAELSKSQSPLNQKAEKLFSGAGNFTAADVQKMFGKYGPLLNPELLQGLATNGAFFQEEVQKGVATFGQFDAKTDDNLFGRAGLVDFKAFALTLGTIADFYAGNTDPETQAALAKFAEECAEPTHRQAWDSTAAKTCRGRFQQIAASYIKNGQFQHKALFQPVGSNVPSMPTTSLVFGKGVERYKELSDAYAKGEARDYGAFKVDFDKELAFGFWGREKDLARTMVGLEAARNAGDLKALKFRALGPTNWFEVLATSPAEPGLAKLQRIPENATREKVLAEFQKNVFDRWTGLDYRPGVYSAGGWSDLHPTEVLKASGCEKVVYLTRKGGDTIFGQQVFVRLTGAQKEVPFWAKIADQNAQGWQVEDPNTPWNRLYNLGNRDSSFQRGLRAADAVYCTDWDKYEVFKGEMWPMVKDAYAAPVFTKPDAKSFALNPARGLGKVPGCTPAASGAESFGAEAADAGGVEEAR